MQINADSNIHLVVTLNSTWASDVPTIFEGESGFVVRVAVNSKIDLEEVSQWQ